MTEGKPVNTTTQYPIDIYGETFYYKVAPNGMITVYHNNWEGITGTGKTIQEAISNVVKFVRESTIKYEGIDDKLYAWCKKIRNLL